VTLADGPPEGRPVPMHPDEPQLTSPIGPDGIDKGLLTDVAEWLFGKSEVRRNAPEAGGRPAGHRPRLCLAHTKSVHVTWHRSP
jgi:hypothetical protein